MLRGYDHALRERLQAIGTAKGITYRFNAPFRKVEKQADGSLLVNCGSGDPIETDLLVSAIGRPANTAGLGLEKIGVELKPEGEVLVDADRRTDRKSTRLNSRP